MADENPDQVHVVAGVRADGGFFALMHRGEDKVRAILASTHDQLMRRVAAAGIGEFGLSQDDSRDMADGTVGALRNQDAAAAVADDPAAATKDPLVDVAGDVVAVQAQLAAVTNDRDALVAQCENLQQELELAEAERDQAKAQYAELAAKLAALEQQNISPDGGSAAAGTQGESTDASSPQTSPPAGFDPNTDDPRLASRPATEA